jgi:4-hydroxybenzoate polyprenyltransferase
VPTVCNRRNRELQTPGTLQISRVLTAPNLNAPTLATPNSFLREELIFILKASRPGFWLTAIWFYLLPLAQRPVLRTFDFWFGIAFVSFAFGLFIYGWNDVGDVEDDQFNTRKGNFLFGARGTREQLRRLPWIIIALHLTCGAFMTWRYGPRVLWWYLALTAATALYNWPRLGFKRWPLLDLLNQAGYLLVFDIATLINAAPPTHWITMLFGVSFAMHSHLLGEILDLDADQLAGRRTTAILLGAVKSKFVLTAFLVWEAWLVWHFFDQRAVAMALAAGAAWFVLDALYFFGPRAYPNWLTRFFLLGWNIVALATMPWVWTHAPFAPR